MCKSVLLLTACLAACLCLVGCFKTKQDYTLNPDGSGKVTYEISFMRGPQAAADPAILKDLARKEADKIVKESQGVTAWKDVTFTVEKNGWTTFKGTAYFEDITKLQIGGSVKSNAALKYTPAAADAAAQLELAMQIEKEPTPAEAPKLTEEEINKKIADAQAQMQRQIPMLTQIMADVQVEWTFTLPGTVEKSVNFQPVADKPNTVRLACDGKKMLEILKGLSEDNAYMRAKVVAGKDPVGPPDPELLNEKLFGTKGPITVSFKPGDKPLFDFAAESDAAKKAMPIAGLEAPAPATTAK
jgi:hypothetical protein